MLCLTSLLFGERLRQLGLVIKTSGIITMEFIAALVSSNPDIVIGLIGWIITTEVMPFIPGPYNGIVQGILEYLTKKKA